MAIIAEVREGGKKKELGVSRLILEPGRKRGEFAVVVTDEYQGQGLGTKLIDMLIEIATEKNLESIYGLIQPENSVMIRLCEKMGFTIKRSVEEVIANLNLTS